EALAETLLAVDELATEFKSSQGRFRAVDEISFTLDKGKTLGMVGESGCGKSVTALSIMGLIPDPPGKIVGGSIRFEGQELVGLAAERYQALRGNRMGMIFQEPMTSLNPAFTVGDQISEAILRHEAVSPADAKARTIELQHPYTIGLMGSVPRLDLDQERLAAIEGQVPNPAALPQGCRFRTRCPFAIAQCAEIDPPLIEVATGHAAACIRAPLDAAA